MYNKKLDKTMEDRKLNEKESLELITQMIRNTRRNLDAGSGNMFLLWGYVCVLLTLVVWAGVGLTQNSAWMWGFWGIPVVGYLLSYIFVRRKGKPVSLYIDKVWGIERSGFFNGREKWAKGFENQRV